MTTSAATSAETGPETAEPGTAAEGADSYPALPTGLRRTDVTGERADLLESLAYQRHFLRLTTRGLADEQATRRTTASELTLASLIKHVAGAERAWLDFVLGGPEALGTADFTQWDAERFQQQWEDEFRVLPGETLAGLLAEYDATARRTEEIVVGLPDLEVAHPLPKAPWCEPDRAWSARRVLLHLIGETAQHAGHADIIRESLDGAKSMG